MEDHNFGQPMDDRDNKMRVYMTNQQQQQQNVYYNNNTNDKSSNNHHQNPNYFYINYNHNLMLQYANIKQIWQL
jgi:hypothetical protein